MVESSLFGSLGHTGVMKGTISIILIISAVQVFEFFFFIIEEFTVDTPFQTMISAIQKELMIVGGMAFVLKCAINTASFDAEWLHSIEMADLIVPVTAFFFCLFGVFFIAILNKEDKIVRIALECSPLDIVNTVIEQKKQVDISWNPFYVTQNSMQLEYHVGKFIFCQEFQVDTDFHFDVYLIKVFEKYIISIINIEASNWAQIILLCLLNWARMELGIFASTSVCEHEDSECINMNDIKVFTVIGAFIFAIVLSVAFMSRVYQLRLFRLYGLVAEQDILTYIESLEAKEKADGLHRPLASSKRHKSKDVKPEAASTFHRELRPTGFQKLLHSALHLMREGLVDLDLVKDPHAPQYSSKMSSIFALRSPTAYFKTIDYLIMYISFYVALWLCNFMYSTDEFPSPERQAWKVISILPGIASMSMYSYVMRASSFLKAVTLLDKDVVEETLEEIKEIKVIAKFLREKIIVSVLEHDEQWQSFEGSIEDYMASLSEDDIHARITSLFSEIDPNKSATLSRSELQTFFTEVGVTFSKKRWRRIFRELDRNGDDEISIEEMIYFLFPKTINTDALEQGGALSVRLKTVNNKKAHYSSPFAQMMQVKTSNKSKKVAAVEEGEGKEQHFTQLP